MRTFAALRRSMHDIDERTALVDAARSFAWAARHRRPVGEPLAGELRLLDRQRPADMALRADAPRA
jgi:hypothetical protein